MKQVAISVVIVICGFFGFVECAETSDVLTNSPSPSFAKTEVLLKIPYHSEAELHALPWSSLTVWYEDMGFIIAQAGNAQRLYELQLPSYTILDYIEPDDRYYLMPAGNSEHLKAIKERSRILLQFRQSVIVQVKIDKEASLLALGLPTYSLLNDAVIPPTVRQPTAPQDLRSDTERISDSLLIKQLIDDVDPENLQSIIYDLQENKDLDPPYTPFRSRFCLRVENTDNPSDDACDNAAEYIFKKFQSYGLKAEYDLFDHVVAADSEYFGYGTKGKYEMRNVVGTLPGNGPNRDKIYIICAHYDSIAAGSYGWATQNRWKTMPAPGADDNASGTAAVLEAARVLSKGSFEYTIRFIAFGGEELWMLGSQHYAGVASESNEEILGVFNLDMIGHESGALDAAVMANQSSAWMANAAVLAKEIYNIGLDIKSYIDPSITNSDHGSFWSKRYSAVVVGESYYGNWGTAEISPAYHTTSDTVDRLNIDLVTRTTQVILATLGELADPTNPDLAVLEDEIQISEKLPISGRTVAITVPVYNIGGSDASNANVNIYLEDSRRKRNELYEGSIDIKAGESKEISTSVNPQWGKYDLVIELNTDFTIFESNGSNNIVKLDFDVIPPDLSVMVGEFRFSDPRMSLDLPITFTVPIHNMGPNDILDADVQVFLISPSAVKGEETQAISENKVSIKANETEEVSAVFTLDELDWYKLIVEVNSEYARLEPDNSNNSAQMRIKASPPNLSISPGDLQISDNSPDKGQQVVIRAQIRNDGSGSAAGANAQFWLIGPSTGNTPQMINEQTLDIKAGESQEISFQVLLSQWGEHEVSVKINPDSTMYETSYDDNIASAIINVSSSSFELVGFAVYPNPIIFRNGSQLRTRYELSKDADTSVQIYTISGGLVYQDKFVSGENGGRAGVNDGMFWRGLNQNGEPVAGGIYVYRIIATDEQGTVKERIAKIAVLK